MPDKHSYELTKLADDDLENIAFYGMQQFGLDQARQYHEGLIRQFERAAESPLQFPVVDGFGTKYRRCVYQKYSIYYTIEETGVLVVRILSRQDVRASLEH